MVLSGPFFQMAISKPSSKTICCTPMVAIFASLATNLLRHTYTAMWETSTSVATSSTNVPFAINCHHQRMLFKFTSEGITLLNNLGAWTRNNVLYMMCNFMSINKRQWRLMFGFVPFLSDSGIKSFIQSNMLYTEGGHICKPCNKFIKTNLSRHVRDVHLSSNLKYQCPLCSTMSPSKNAFQIHLRRHHGSEHFRGLDFEQCVVYSE